MGLLEIQPSMNLFNPLLIIHGEQKQNTCAAIYQDTITEA